MPKEDRSIQSLIDLYRTSRDAFTDQDMGEYGRQLIREWQAATGRPITGKIGQQRFAAIEDALDLGADPEELRHAVWGISESPWHAERGIDEFKVAISETQHERLATLGRARLQEMRRNMPNEVEREAYHHDALEQGYIVKDGVYVLEEEDEHDRQLRLAVFGEPDLIYQSTEEDTHAPPHDPDSDGDYDRLDTDER